jgi:3-phenylpropionate/cinnamic acid dioxygenase small subunit
MNQRVHNPNAHISPRSRHSRLIPNPQISERQDGADEVRRLLVQVVEILRGPLQVRRQHFLHA